MTRQWIRDVSLTIDAGGETIDVSNLRIRFKVTQNRLQTPNAAEITITNLKEETAQKIKKEGQSVTLSAGYQGVREVIFRGNLIQKRTGRENPVDTYCSLLATSGDKAYNFATVSKTLAAGSTFKDQVDVVLEAFKPHGITAGYIADLGTKQMPRPRVLFGMARDVMRDIAFSTGSSWFIENDKLNITKNNEPRPGEAFVINSNTGMIGRPVQTLDGIIVRMLLNPKVRPDTRLKIDQSSIDQAAFSPNYTAEVQNSMIPSLADDGLYRVLVADLIGDTEGNIYYTDATCIRADGQGPQPIRLVQQGIDLDPGQ
ncbi:hypothetical protein [Bosea sp. ASV33]|uniref:phage protein n=1 Tax=Bosea sp. ASV33 TaxID=2795106 RepID=UPI0018EB5B2F|nr:hypothetical protein [Bosea sp. ASV33]